VQTKITVQNVSYTYADGIEALKNVSLNIRSNEIFVLFGPARGGKTTLLRLFNRLSDLTKGADYRGKILVDGQDIFARGVNVTDLRRRIGMVFAVPTPLPGSIRSNLTYGPRMAGIRGITLLNERIERSLTQAALWDEVKDRLHQPASRLSGGQKQRLCIARSLMLEPEVLILDNPTSGLDPISTGMVEESLYELKKQYTVIMVPHSVQQAARVATRAAFIMDGEMIEVDVAERMFKNPKDQRTEDYITGRFG
jgi:phosphate transport system ATP-binding protein